MALLLPLGIPTPESGGLLHYSDADAKDVRDTLNGRGSSVITALHEP